VFKFEGIDSISDAERWAGADVLVADTERELPEEGAYSHAYLIGCVLWNRDVKTGVVRSVEDYGGGPLLEVKLEDGRDVLVPFTLAICKEIDVAAKTIRAELPEGLLDK
jgi:16S rRNA processing protein RimM